MQGAGPTYHWLHLHFECLLATGCQSRGTEWSQIATIIFKHQKIAKVYKVSPQNIV